MQCRQHTRQVASRRWHQMEVGMLLLASIALTAVMLMTQKSGTCNHTFHAGCCFHICLQPSCHAAAILLCAWALPMGQCQTFESFQMCVGHRLRETLFSCLQLPRAAGAPWKVFNVIQKEKRRAMLQLYGIKKRLLTHGPVMESKDFIPLLLIQVSHAKTLLHSTVCTVLQPISAVCCDHTYNNIVCPSAYLEGVASLFANFFAKFLHHCLRHSLRHPWSDSSAVSFAAARLMSCDKRPCQSLIDRAAHCNAALVWFLFT